MYLFCACLDGILMAVSVEPKNCRQAYFDSRLFRWVDKQNKSMCVQGFHVGFRLSLRQWKVKDFDSPTTRSRNLFHNITDC